MLCMPRIPRFSFAVLDDPIEGREGHARLPEKRINGDRLLEIAPGDARISCSLFSDSCAQVLRCVDPS